MSVVVVCVSVNRPRMRRGQEPTLTAVNAERRKYALLKIAPGDYLWPDNDGRTLWRVHRYREDGSLYWSDDDGHEHKFVGNYWRVLRYRGTVQTAPEDDDLTEWWDDRWIEWASLLDSRTQAINAVMKATERTR